MLVFCLIPIAILKWLLGGGGGGVLFCFVYVFVKERIGSDLLLSVMWVWGWGCVFLLVSNVRLLKSGTFLDKV